MNYTVDDQPWLTTAAINYLNNYINKIYNIKILEFGSGGSTLWFAKQANINTIISIEHDPRWLKKVESKLQTLNLSNKNLKRFLLNTPNYFLICNNYPNNFFDIILVDSIQRIKCIENSIRVLRPGGILILDNCENEKYKVIYNLLRNWKLTKTKELIKKNSKTSMHYTDWWIKPD